MKLLSFADDGKEWFGAARDDGIVTLNDKIGQPDLRAALAAGAMEAMRRAAKDAAPDRRLDDIKFLPVIPRPGKILCAGLNYRSHVAEMGRELPKQPSMFARFADTLVGHGGEMSDPRFRTISTTRASSRSSSAKADATSRRRARLTTSPAIRASLTAAYAIIRSSQ
jgi:2-keto-4-pentenoate hydratase/2-oxohepta-3-ene-1,7-dioic acid hydratase in catechol pathway